MSYFSGNLKTASGPSDPDTGRRLLAQVNARFGADWKSRGYQIVETKDGFSLLGDTGRFYFDVVTDEAHAALAMAFLARFSRDDYLAWCDAAAEDMIDLDESQEIFLQGQTIEDRIATS